MNWTDWTFTLSKEGSTQNPPPEYNGTTGGGIFAFQQKIEPDIYLFENPSGSVMAIQVVGTDDNNVEVTASSVGWNATGVNDASLQTGTVQLLSGSAAQAVMFEGDAPALPDRINWALYKFDVQKDGATINPPPEFADAWEGGYWHTQTYNLTEDKKVFMFLQASGAELKIVQELNGDVGLEFFSPNGDVIFVSTASQAGLLAGLSGHLFAELDAPTTTQDLDVTPMLSDVTGQVSNVSTKSRMPRAQSALLSYARGVASETGNEAIGIIALDFANALQGSRDPRTRSKVQIQMTKDAEARLRKALQVAVENQKAEARAVASLEFIKGPVGVTLDEAKAGSVRIRVRGRKRNRPEIVWYEVHIQTIVEAPLETESETLQLTKESMVWMYPAAFNGRTIGVKARLCTIRNGNTFCGPWSEVKVIRLVDAWNEE
jgi:hypothetical protein